MLVGVLQFELIIPESRSLKDKRRIVKSVKDKLHREHLVSVAEVEALDQHRLAVMGLSLVSNSSVYIHSVFDRILHKLSMLEGARLGEVMREVLHGDQLPAAFETEEGEPLWTEGERRADAEDAS